MINNNIFRLENKLITLRDLTIQIEKKYLFYFAVELIIENKNIPENIELINEKDILKNVLDKINFIYREIKKNEIDPGTDYLFNGINKNDNNFEKSIEKMEIMNGF